MARPSPRRPTTAGEYIVESLREDILTGRLEAGEPLPLDQLAERFGTSVIPIREALRALEAERLVVLRPHRTAQVAELSLRQLQELYGVRLVLEPEAVRLAHGNLTPEELAELRELVDEMERLALEGDQVAAYEIHTDLHFQIYAAAGSSVLLATLERLWDECVRYWHAFRRYSSDPRAWGDEHRRLLALLESGTAEEAAEETRAHLARTLATLVEVRTRDEEPEAPSPPSPQAATRPPPRRPSGQRARRARAGP